MSGYYSDYKGNSNWMNQRYTLAEIAFLALCILLAFAVRIHLLFASNFVVDGDEAIVGLMAMHILEGGGIPVFYYGQHYMGSLEALLVAGAFLIGGVSAVALKSVPLLFSVALIPLSYALYRRVMPQYGARCAVLLLSLPPLALVEWSSRARGGFIEVIVIGTWALLAFVRFVESGKRFELYFCWFLLGLGWWVNNQIVFFAGPVGVFTALALIFRQEGHPRYQVNARLVGLALCGLFFVLGGLPYWIYNVENKFVSFAMLTASDGANLWKHTVGAFSYSLPILFGAKRFWQVNEVFPLSFWLTYLLYGSIFVGMLWSLRTEISYCFVGKVTRATCKVLLPAIFVFAITVFVVSSFGSLSQAPRYLLPLYVPLFGMVGMYVATLAPRRGDLARGVVGALLLVNLLSVYAGGISVPGEPLVYDGQRVAKDHKPLIDWLAQKNITAVRTNYWIGYRLAFETKERVTFTMFHEPRHVRLRSYEIGFPDDLTLPLILVPSQAPKVKKGMNYLGFSFLEETVSGYVVLYDIKGNTDYFNYKLRCHPQQVFASDNSDKLPAMFDDNLRTRWGSGRPQSPDMEIRVSFSEPKHLSALQLLTGDFYTDAPRRYEIDVIEPNGDQQLLYEHQAIEAIHAFLDHRTDFLPLPRDKPLKGLVIRQTGTDPIFDWSIAELNLFSVESISNGCVLPSPTP